MSFPRYPKYKDSGVAWLGEVPEHWEFGALKHFVLPRAGSIKTGPFGSQLTSADMQGGSTKVYNQRSIIDADFESGDDFISEEKFSDLASFQTFPGDLLITTRGTIGRAAILPQTAERGILHPCVLRVQPDNERIRTEFLMMLIQDSDLLKAQLNYLSNATTIEVIYSHTIASVFVPVPPLAEQSCIAEFLGRETAKIDELVAEQQRLMDLLKEKRQAVISHAVTKGLNPRAPMKPSGIEWLGDVPAHWRVVQLGKVCDKVSDGPHFSPQCVDTGVLFLSARNVKVDGWALDDVKYVSESDCEEFDRRVVPQIGDVLYTKGGTTGIARVVDLEGRFQGWVHIAVLKVKQDMVDSHFLAFALNSVGCYEQSQLLTRGATNNDLGLTRMIKIWFVLPPIEEQRQVVAFLRSETKMIDALAAEAQKAIDLLQERRTALITAAVTGQIDVRRLAAA
jgi:type I restriction enzyme S subunit